MLNISKCPYRPSGQHLWGVALAASTLVSCLALAIGAAPASASVPLTRADIEAILNRVELIPRGRAARVARPRDIMAVGDTLRTAAQSQAQLRFNDGSLARVGQRATFRFVPNTRNFRLTDGTMLLLIPPGRGRSTIQTPSAITGIQGSAVVVRHVKSRNLTVVMALTNNPAGPMTVTTAGCGDPMALPSDLDELGTDLSKQGQIVTEPSELVTSSTEATQCLTEHSLQAGQMALIQDNQVQILEFDLPTFYETSPLVDGLELDNPDAQSSLGPALEQVRAETLEALSREAGFADATVLNPAVVGLDGEDSTLANQPWLLSPVAADSISQERTRIFPPAGTLVNLPTNLPPASGPRPEPIDRTPAPEPQPPVQPINRTPAPEPQPPAQPIDWTPAPEPQPPVQPIDRTPAPDPLPNPRPPVDPQPPTPDPSPGVPPINDPNLPPVDPSPGVPPIDDPNLPPRFEAPDKTQLERLVTPAVLTN